MDQTPDDPTNIIATVLGTITAVITAVAGAYAVVLKSRTQTRKEASEIAHLTVQSTLDAMKVVIDGLTNELARRQAEVDATREDIETLLKENRELSMQTSRQERQIADLQHNIDNMGKTMTNLKFRLERCERGLGHVE